ncbi:MAG: DUF368 domain-containing protein [Clostridia bacterium]|nr:DUF368 domain-containing protein [Clostridia bacterium]
MKRGKPMRLLLNVIKGFVTGMAVMIPGVSAGSMAMSMGMYSAVLTLVSGKEPERKQTLPALIPYGAGILLGIVAFAFLLMALLTRFPLQTAMVFVGLILGGVPALTRTVKGTRFRLSHAAAFLTALAAMVLLLVFSGGADNANTLEPSVINFVIAMALGFVAAATMVIPGISGSAVMLIAGYYYEVTNSIKELTEGVVTLNGGMVWESAFVLVPFALGAVAGVVLASKLIRRLLERVPVTTCWALIALMAASPAAVLLKIEVDYAAVTWVGYAVAVLCLAAGFAVAYFLSREGKSGAAKRLTPSVKGGEA